jgi:hypothetical protein
VRKGCDLLPQDVAHQVAWSQEHSPNVANALDFAAPPVRDHGELTVLKSKLHRGWDANATAAKGGQEDKLVGIQAGKRIISLTRCL